jgi:hypothetical protein
MAESENVSLKGFRRVRTAFRRRFAKAVREGRHEEESRLSHERGMAIIDLLWPAPKEKKRPKARG